MGFDSGTPLVVDGVTYTFPVGGATMMVGDSTDLSALFTGACVYSAFTDQTPDDCGTGNSIGAGGKGVATAMSYAFDSGFSLAGGVTSGSTEILGDAADAYGINAAYSADSWGAALAYVSDDGGTGDDVRNLKKQYPGVPVVSYVNTSADVKAETDVCCTSANAVKIVESLGVKKVIFLPDDFLAKYVASQTDIEIISWKGTCEVHEQFNDQEINDIRKANPGIKIIAHPECPPDVIQASDFAGSTSGMIKYVRDNQPDKVMMVTECSMSDNVQIDNPNVEFIRPCNLCPHMKRITLPKILNCLENESNELVMDDQTIAKARKSVERMAEIGR